MKRGNKEIKREDRGENDILGEDARRNCSRARDKKEQTVERRLRGRRKVYNKQMNRTKGGQGGGANPVDLRRGSRGGRF